MASVLFACLALAGCARLDAEQARLCVDVLPALEPSQVKLRVVEVEPAGRRAVRVDFDAVDAEGGARRRFAICEFGGGAFAGARLALVGLRTDQGEFGPARLVFLDRFWLRAPGARAEARARFLDAPTGAADSLAFFAQAIVNGLPWAAILALVATAYALLYGITERINLAFGDLAVVGAYGALGAVALAAAAGGADAAVIGATLVAAVATAALASRALAAAVVQPLAVQPGRMLLVATIGVSIVIQEGLRLAQGSGQRWLPPLFTDAARFGSGFVVTFTTMQALAVAAAAGTALGVVVAMRRSRFGLAWRALADDPLATRLCGLDPRRILAWAMTIAGALAGLAGAIVALAYGNAHYAMGTALGLKAIVAAILGGVGSIGGALAGGLVVGLAEALWSAYLPIESRDVAVYALVAVLLALRPRGLFGDGGAAARRA